MAAEADHIAKANHNHDALAHLLDSVDKFPDWVVTIAFYKAVHVVEAAFAVKGLHSTSHDNRERRLAARPYSSIFKHYTHLVTASRIARYLEDRSGSKYKTFTDYMAPHLVRELVRKRLYGVEQEALL
jgi:hypothetical protein